MGKRGLKKPKFLRRFLKKGERLVIKGETGKRVKTTRLGRKYILEIRNRKNQLVGYVNGRKGNRPEAREFTRSMLARVKSTREHVLTEGPQSGGNYSIVSSRKIKSQLSPKMLREIRKNKGKAFALKVQIEGNTYLTHSVFFSGRMTNEDLKNLITSDLLYTINRENYRVSPKPENIKDKSKIKRIRKAKLTLQFSEVKSVKYRPRKNENRRRSRNRRSKRERTTGRL